MPDRARMRFRGAQRAQRLKVPGTRIAHSVLKPSNSFNIVSVDVQPRLHHLRNAVHVALEIRNERFDQNLGIALFDLANGRCEVTRSAVFHVVAIDHRQDDIMKAQNSDTFGNLVGLFRIQRRRNSRSLHGAKTTSARAGVRAQHEGGGT